MAPSVHLTKKGQARLDELRAKLARLGHRFTKRRVLELALAAATPGDIIALSQGVRYPIPDWQKVARDIVDSAEDMGPTSWRDIDRIVYGGTPKR